MEYTLVKLWELIPTDKKKCGKCGVDLTPEITDIHHIDGKRFNNKPENLELLCQSCHRGHKRPRNKPMNLLVTMRFNEELLTKINLDAENSGTDVSKVIRRIVSDYYSR